MKEYEVSIVTPFHNVDIKVFKTGMESMQKQTYGFSNIEWVIVVHNSDKEYLEALHELCDAYENIVLCVLNNKIHTPSSPRNHGMRRAHGRYIGFLDADDSLTPNCVKDVIYHMKKTGAQITWFRREYELENKNAVPITELVLWDQTQKEIIVDRDHWDDEKMFSGICGMVTSRMYDREFLVDNNIYFDETVPFAEDYLFNVVAYGHADKICYLPQTIGYHYYINSGSLVQSQEKNAETLIAYAKGYKKLFDTGLEYGFYMNAIISRLLVVLCRFMAASNKLTYEDRKEIRDILGPYVEMTTYLKQSKVYSEMAVQESYNIPRDVILNIDKWSNMEAQNGLLAGDVEYGSRNIRELLLRDILEKNAGTDMGGHYGFSSIYTIAGYRSRVPLMNYDDYSPLINLNTRIGESSIFVSDPIQCYTYRVSNSGRVKMLPCTYSFISDYVKVFVKELAGEHSFLLMQGVRSSVSFNDNTYMASIPAIMVNGIMNIKSRFPDIDISEGHLEVLEKDSMGAMQQKLLNALLDGKITQIVTNNTYVLMRLIDKLDQYRASLYTNLTHKKSRSYTGDTNIDVSTVRFSFYQERVEELLELSRQYEEGETNDVLKAIWPNFKRVVACGTGEFRYYTDMVKAKYPEIELVSGPLYAPEIVLGEPVPGDDEYRLYREGAFLELEPVDAVTLKPTGELVLDNEVVPGQTYRVYATNKAGLYRYDTEHIILVTRVEGEDVIFQLMDQIISRVTLEKAIITTGDACELTEAIESSLHIGIQDFVISNDDDSLVLYLDIKEEKKPEDSITKQALELAEAYLREHIAGYEEGRNNGMIGPIRIKYLSPETSLLFVELNTTKLTVNLDYVLPQHYVWTPDHKKFLEHCVIE